MIKNFLLSLFIIIFTSSISFSALVVRKGFSESNGRSCFTLVSLDFTDEGLVKITIDTKRRTGCDRYKKRINYAEALPFVGTKKIDKEIRGY